MTTATILPALLSARLHQTPSPLPSSPDATLSILIVANMPLVPKYKVSRIFRHLFVWLICATARFPTASASTLSTELSVQKLGVYSKLSSYITAPYPCACDPDSPLHYLGQGRDLLLHSTGRPRYRRHSDPSRTYLPRTFVDFCRGASRTILTFGHRCSYNYAQLYLLAISLFILLFSSLSLSLYSLLHFFFCSRTLSATSRPTYNIISHFPPYRAD